MALLLLLSCQVSWQLCAFCDASCDHRVCDCNGQVEASIIAETGDVRLSNQSYVILRHAELSLLGALPVSAKSQTNTAAPASSIFFSYNSSSTTN